MKSLSQAEERVAQNHIRCDFNALGEGDNVGGGGAFEDLLPFFQEVDGGPHHRLLGTGKPSRSKGCETHETAGISNSPRTGVWTTPLRRIRLWRYSRIQHRSDFIDDSHLSHLPFH